MPLVWRSMRHFQHIANVIHAITTKRHLTKCSLICLKLLLIAFSFFVEYSVLKRVWSLIVVCSHFSYTQNNTGKPEHRLVVDLCICESKFLQMHTSVNTISYLNILLKQAFIKRVKTTVFIQFLVSFIALYGHVW